MKKYLKCKYYFNASHSLTHQHENRHSHSFSITLYLAKGHQEAFLPFYLVDEIVSRYLGQYTDTYLDDLTVFKDKETTIENMGDLFYEDLKAQFKIRGLDLLQLEICERPVRVYIVSDCILMASMYAGDNKRRWEEILNKQQQFVKERKDEVVKDEGI